MKRLYIECNMGAAGDMLTAALFELYPDREGFLKQMNALGLPGVTVSCVSAVKCGISGSHMVISVNGQEENGDSHEKAHTTGHNYESIKALITQLPVPAEVRENALAVYQKIGEAEARVHGAALEQIHFHEIGTLDAVADVVGCCLLFHLLDADEITASPVHVGSGFVRCAHGLLPVPAPATAQLLTGVPIYGGDIRGELCTPTGAALLRHFVSRFGPMPPMRVDKIGYGMGTKDFEAANCVRAFWSETEEHADEIAELRCNLDDMTPEAVGFAIDRLFEGGALDVFATPVQMKKSRPSVLLTCLCKPQLQEELTRLMLLHTTTLGVRMSACSRTILKSSFQEVQTKYGSIRIKVSQGSGITKYKPEYEDVKKAAEAHGAPFDAVYKRAVAEAENLFVK
ncbi:MAG: nickel pincer cofactor biosynthesis protein LarC [Ruminococcaceae bacterium]|nr:nickel pincer cofactor biosynthesis protein LarC [Oscillospiraceae bacterium]